MGKSISHSLEDDDLGLIQTATTTRGGASSDPRTTQEQPPSSIFKINPLVLTSGYLRMISIDDKIPTKVCALCYYYYAPKHKSLVLDSNNASTKMLIIRSIDDQSYDNIEMGHATSILGQSPIIKLSSTRNLKMDWNSSISIDESNRNKNGSIILTVFGDINMGKNTQLLCRGDGNIYIECNNLIMRTGSIITTTYASVTSTDKYNKADLKEFGNIYMRIKQSLIMDNMTTIKSGNIKIECQQLKLAMKSEIKALRKHLWIIAQNGIISDEDLNNALYAKIQKRIDNKNELNNNITKIKQQMRENIGYKLTMFNINEEGSDQDFECCICWENAPNILIKPCHHSTFCESCIVELNPTECPICRGNIMETQKF